MTWILLFGDLKLHYYHYVQKWEYKYLTIENQGLGSKIEGYEKWHKIIWEQKDRASMKNGIFVIWNQKTRLKMTRFFSIICICIDINKIKKWKKSENMLLEFLIFKTASPSNARGSFKKLYFLIQSSLMMISSSLVTLFNR